MARSHNIYKAFMCLWFVVICCVLVFNNCANATPDAANESSKPSEENCTIEIIATLTVSNFDGAEVEWKASRGKSWTIKEISAGSHTFTVDYRRNVQGGYHYQRDITVAYDKFVAGRKYEMVAAEGAEAGGFGGMFKNPLKAMRDTASKALRIGIRDITNGRKGEFEWLDPEEDPKDDTPN